MTGARGCLLKLAAAVAIALLPLAVSIQPAAAQAPAGFAVHERPRPLPDIHFENAQGEAMSLADLRGKIVLLNIWATWCVLGLRELGMYVDTSGKAPRELSALGVPTTLLIDREGNELGRLAGRAEWDSPEMVAFIRGYIEQQSGAVLGPVSTEVQLAFAAAQPVAPSIWSRSFLPVAGTNHLQRWKETMR